MALFRYVDLGPSGNKLSKDDLARALICSTAVYEENAIAAHYKFAELEKFYPSATFEKVLMSKDPGEGPQGRNRGCQKLKFLVAYSEDSVFIAFRGTQGLRDAACDLRVTWKRGPGGYYHKGFYDRAESFLGEHQWDPLPGLMQHAERRIVLCGHSLGGAVAHMVLCAFLLHEGKPVNDDQTSVKYSDSIISIAFGSPHICDKEAAGKINGNANFKWRFVNFVNQTDPVPHMLHDLRKTAGGVLKKALVKADSTLQSLGGFAGLVLEGYVEEGKRGAVKAAFQGAAHQVAKCVQVSAHAKAQAVAEATLGATSELSSGADDLEVDLSEPGLYGEPDFYPIGQYLYIHRDDGDYWGLREYHGGQLEITALFRTKVEYQEENLECHQLGNYRKALRNLCFIDSASGAADAGYRSAISPNPSAGLPTSFLVTTPAPTVKIARLEVVDTNKRLIVVVGENLLFLREAVTVAGLRGQQSELWKILTQRDQWLAILGPKINMLEEHNNKHIQNAVALVIIKTAFGEISHPIVPDEDNTNEEIMQIGASRMLLGIAQSLMVKATPPLKILPHSNIGVMKRLDNIMLCVPSLSKENMKVSAKFALITTFTNTTGADFEGHIRELNFMFRSVIQCSRSRLNVDYKKPGLQKRIKKFLRSHPMMAVPAVIASLSVLPITLGAVFGYLIFQPEKTSICGYASVLQSAIEEVSAWPMRTSSQLQACHSNELGSPADLSIAELEMELVRKVAERCGEFRDMVASAHTARAEDVPGFKSELFRKATPESRIKLLKRIKVVCDIVSLYDDVVRGTHYLGVFGAEDAGKSTFVQKALEYGPKFYSGALPETGINTHTRMAQPYKLSSSLWLVDFPGSNGIQSYADVWRQYTALPSSALLFLEFNFDVKREQVSMYKDMKRNLGAQTEVAVVFNKVDARFSPTTKATLTSVDYFKKHRGMARKAFECSDNVGIHYTCVDPDPPEKLHELENSGASVLGFDDLWEKVRPALQQIRTSTVN